MAWWNNERGAVGRLCGSDGPIRRGHNPALCKWGATLRSREAAHEHSRRSSRRCRRRAAGRVDEQLLRLSRTSAGELRALPTPRSQHRRRTRGCRLRRCLAWRPPLASCPPPSWPCPRCGPPFCLQRSPVDCLEHWKRKDPLGAVADQRVLHRYCAGPPPAGVPARGLTSVPAAPAGARQRTRQLQEGRMQRGKSVPQARKSRGRILSG